MLYFSIRFYKNEIGRVIGSLSAKDGGKKLLLDFYRTFYRSSLSSVPRFLCYFLVVFPLGCFLKVSLIFSKNVLFVEGITEYILFNSILREMLEKEINDIEVIPIFSKFHYIFFDELAKKMGLNYWFLLDDDRKVDEGEGKTKWLGKKRIFWEKYGKEEVSEEINGIIHNKEGSRFRISWFFSDVEKFLGVELSNYEEIHKCCKEYNLISRAKDILDNLEKKPEKVKELKRLLSFVKVKKSLNNA
ncbi:MAG: hypothetical protein MRERV_43c016 [Mycoplasmataceae bacterium RV_VA103A]|nr:MAG: hypothetical protein MRERV_43c016 [Mycoplasmataceae bacterium RV_VA103A]